MVAGHVSENALYYIFITFNARPHGTVVEHWPLKQASHQCGPGSISGLGVKCGLSLFLVLVLAQEVFLRVLRFSPILKNQHFQIPIRSGIQGLQIFQSDRTVKCHPR